MILSIDSEKRLSGEEHLCLFIFFQLVYNTKIEYSKFRIYESLIEKYNNSTMDIKQNIANTVTGSSNCQEFIRKFAIEPWRYEKPVIWKDRKHSSYFIEQLEKSHAFEVYIDCEFKKRGVNIGLYYGKDSQYSGESEVGIEIKYDEKSKSTGNYYIEYQERMFSYGVWVNSGILKKDNSKFYLFGTLDGYVIFERSVLLDYYNQLIRGISIDGARLVIAKRNTSKGFILMPKVWKNLILTLEQTIDKI